MHALTITNTATGHTFREVFTDGAECAARITWLHRRGHYTWKLAVTCAERVVRHTGNGDRDRNGTCPNDALPGRLYCQKHA